MVMAGAVKLALLPRLMLGLLVELTTTGPPVTLTVELALRRRELPVALLTQSAQTGADDPTVALAVAVTLTVGIPITATKYVRLLSVSPAWTVLPAEGVAVTALEPSR